ncbi:dephospho-CoA kinase [Laribacter hongkongensis]|uniref:dephospho-CoA kinase n=1 Tax=Laribacter hongkongensis TaxID=168471 RepID=UPI001EFE3943|nr:dephospho-CoA kinase [Laribacter hongkongensis]MCG9076445.1 dephospho-CoA kinase [Laribacter hongkongensis]
MAASVIGLTGGIGSGKSAVAEEFARLGICVVDADAIAHALTAPGGAAMPLLQQAFGTEVVRADGALDREVMRARVFSDPVAREQLNALLHPLIAEEAQRELAAARSPYVVLMVPLLFESGHFAGLCQRVLVVDCPEQVQIERVRQRSGLAAEQVVAIMAAQLSRADRLARADDVIDNSGARDSLPAQVAGLHRSYLQLSRQPSCSS